MSGTTSGTTNFVLGTVTAGNREMHVLTTGLAYDIDAAAITAYSADATEFPVV
jgi:hypothetical protein